ncbi:MAG: hypothetical protein H7099_17560 [Gemmatimonadaceae bacterium]|nr:hypothetical protein [Gemmatimonadaceae bacterium]
MNGQYLRVSDTAPSIEVFFANTSDGSARTDLVFNTSGLTLGYRRPGAAVTNLTLVTLASATAAWAAGGFIHLSGGLYRLDLPTAANATGVSRVAVVSVALPTGVAFNPCIVALGADDLTAAAPTTGDFITGLRAENVGSAWGVTSQPSGGATVTYSERRAVGGTLGTRTAYYDSTGKLAGLTAVV